MRWNRRLEKSASLGDVVEYRRTDVPNRKLMRGQWPRDLRTVRTVLPEHLQRALPLGTAAHGSWIVVAAVGRMTVGYAWAVHEAGNPHGAYIEEVAVISEFQRRGVGSHLVRLLAAWMCELDRQDLSILPIGGSDWIKRLGFRPSKLGSGYTAQARDVAIADDSSPKR